MQVAVGSRKRYKIDATANAFALLLPTTDVQIAGVAAESGVSPQPMSNEESITGARNRALAALADTTGSPDMGVGIENGLVFVDTNWFATTWIVAVSSSGRESMASTLFRQVPGGIMDLVKQGHELSVAIRMAHGVVGDEGLIGLITNGILLKHEVLRDGIVTAVSPLLTVQPESNNPAHS